MKHILLLLLLILPLAPSFAAEPMPAYLQPQVLKAGLAISLTGEQKPLFNNAITTLFNERMRALNKLMRRNNQSGIERKMKSKTNSLLKDMDKEVGLFLSEEQMVAYFNYRDLLKANMRGM